MDGLAAAKSIRDTLASMAAIKEGASFSGDEWLETSLKHQLTLEQKIASCTGFTVSQASDVIMDLRQAAVPDSFKSVLASAVHHKIISVSKAGLAAQKQHCEHMEAFVRTGQWETLYDKSKWKEHVPSMGDLMERMGLSNADESTFQSAVSIICMARMEAANKNHVCSKAAYEMLQMLKRIVRRSTKKVRLPHYDKIKVYPTTPEALKTENPEIYRLVYDDKAANLLPCTCPLKQMHLQMLKKRLPMRSTHAGLAIELHTHEEEVHLPGFRFCSRRSMHEEAVDQAVRPYKALEDRSPLRGLLALPPK